MEAPHPNPTTDGTTSVRVQVSVAVVGPAMVPLFMPLPPGDGGNKIWEDRRKVSIAVEASTTLGSIVDAAADLLGVQLDPAWASSSSPSREILGVWFDQPGEIHPAVMAEFTLVDANGQASWQHCWAQVTYGDVQRAAEAGLVDGDISRLYFRPRPQQGTPGAGEWQQFLHALELAWRVFEGVGVAYGSSVAVKAGLRRVQRGIDGVRRRWREWQGRGATPYRVELLLIQRNWSTEEVAALLGCDLAEAKAICGLFGFAWDSSSKRWQQGGGDPVAVLLAGNLTVMLWDEATFGATREKAAEQRMKFLRERLEYLAIHGSAPPEPNYGEVVEGGWEPPQ